MAIGMKATATHGARFALTVLLLVALSLASCSSAKQPTKQASKASGVVGIVEIGQGGMRVFNPTPSPIPVLSPGGFGLGGDFPYPDVTVVGNAASGKKTGVVVARVRPNAQAIFRETLPPGRYALSTGDLGIAGSGQGQFVRDEGSASDIESPDRWRHIWVSLPMLVGHRITPLRHHRLPQTSALAVMIRWKDRQVAIPDPFQPGVEHRHDMDFPGARFCQTLRQLDDSLLDADY